MITGDLDSVARALPALGGMIGRVLDRVEAELDEFAANVEDRVLARLEAADAALSAEFKEALGRGVRACVRDALARLRSQAELPQKLPPDLSELARLQAGSSCDPREFADAWLVGQEVFWNRFELVVEQTVEEPALCLGVIRAARMRLNGYAASLSGLFRDVWAAERARGEGTNGDPRWQTVSRALDGHWVDPGELGYDLACHHIAVVADAPSALEALARHTERQQLAVSAPGGGTWGWLGGASPLSDGEVDALVAWQRAHKDGVVAFGEPAPGIDGFAATHQQALEARTIAAATGQCVVRFADVRLLVAVLRDGELAKEFVERELGELEHPNKRTHELRETLRAYLEHSQSISATAALRRRDRKTIARQLRMAEDLIEHTVSDRSDELLLALRVAEILQNRG